MRREEKHKPKQKKTEIRKGEIRRKERANRLTGAKNEQERRRRIREKIAKAGRGRGETSSINPSGKNRQIAKGEIKRKEKHK